MDATAKTDGSSFGNFNYYVCTGSASAGSGNADVPIAIAYREQGGSIFGTNPVGSKAIGFYSVNASAACPAATLPSGNVVAGAAPSGGAICSGWAATNTANTAVFVIPDAGISDEEPSLFTNALNKPSSCTSAFGDAAACPATASNFVSTPVLIQAMGVTASQPLLTALTNAGSTVTQNGVTKPTMNTNWIQAAFAKSSSIYNFDTTAIGSNTNTSGHGDWAPLSDLVAYTTGVTTAPFGGSVIICRRAAGSGTQAALNARFFNTGCGPATNTQTVAVKGNSVTTLNGVAFSTASLASPLGIPTAGFYEVYENGSSGAVKTCMQQAASAGLLAVGILSLDQGTLPGYDFLAIDGNIASDGSVTNGAYNYTVESTFQISNITANAPLAGALRDALASVTTVSPAGVYNILPTAGAPSGNSLAKTMKGTTAGVTCKNPIF
jgi:hypothetical protein